MRRGRTLRSGPAPRLLAVASFKPAYLIHGDDHGRIGERRSRLRAVAEAESGAQGVEVLEGDDSAPESVASALSAMTFALGRRFVVVDGVERWKDRDLNALETALAHMPPDTTVAFFAREEGRWKAPPPARRGRPRSAGGDVAAEMTVKPWELPKWVAARARELGLELDAGAARALVAHVGDRQQRLLRDLEKLADRARPGRADRDRRGRRAHRPFGRATGVDAGQRPRRRRRGARDPRLPRPARPGGTGLRPALP